MASVLNYHPKKGLTSHFSFESDPEVHISKQVVNTFKDALTEQNVERFIERQVDPAFKEIANKHDMTLTEVIAECANLMADHKTAPTVVDSPEGFATFLSNLAPDKEPSALLEHNRTLIEGIGEKAVKILEDRLKVNGRKNGYILLRATDDQKKAVKAEQEAKAAADAEATDAEATDAAEQEVAQ